MSNLELEKITEKSKMLENEIRKVFLGNPRVVELITIAVLTRGHIILEGNPGVGKTALLLALAKTISGKYERISGTPDLLPYDFLRIAYIEDGKVKESPGPLIKHGDQLAIFFMNEINRVQPKTQSALLEAMEERSVTTPDGKLYYLPHLIVVADRNKLEKEETFELPHAQRDRFFMEIEIPYTDKESEKEIARNPKFRDIKKKSSEVNAIFTLEELKNIEEWIQANIIVSDELIEYIANIAQATRKPSEFDIKPADIGLALSEDEDFHIDDIIAAGISTRGIQLITMAAKTNAALRKSMYVEPEDIKNIIFSVACHRVFLAAHHEKRRSGLAKSLIEAILKKIPTPTPPRKK